MTKIEKKTEQLFQKLKDIFNKMKDENIMVIFNKYDKKNKGHLTKGQFKKFLSDFLKIDSRQQLNLLFNKFNMDNDENIDVDEFLDQLSGLREMKQLKTLGKRSSIACKKIGIRDNFIKRTAWCAEVYFDIYT